MQNTLKVTLFWRLHNIFLLVFSALRVSIPPSTMSVVMIMGHKGFEKSNHWEERHLPWKDSLGLPFVATVDDDHN